MTNELRHQIEAWIDRAIDLLDAIDGDPDAEFETDFDINPVSLQAADRKPPKPVWEDGLPWSSAS